MTLTLEDMRRYAIARSLIQSPNVMDALNHLGFVQADPIRSPAKAQDLILRHRVLGYKVGQLEGQYPELPLEEDFFVNYGFLPKPLADLMHPRTARNSFSAADQRRVNDVLAFVRERGVVHPSEVDAQFKHGTRQNWFGGKSRVSTQLLDAMHYRGLLRTAKRESGIRCYAIRNIAPHQLNSQEAIDSLVDVFVKLYAPLPAKSLGYLCSLLGRGVPQWHAQRQQTLARAKQRLASAYVGAGAGGLWFWPAQEDPLAQPSGPALLQARLLAPFDPIVWDRTRFEWLWDWPYRFEAYTPASKRQLGYYAMPLLYGDDVVGWGNVDGSGESLQFQLGLKRRVTKTVIKKALAEDMQAMSTFLAKPIGSLRWV